MFEVIVKHFPCVTRPPTSHDSKGVVAGEEGAEDSVADDDGALLPDDDVVDLFIFEKYYRQIVSSFGTNAICSALIKRRFPPSNRDG